MQSTNMNYGYNQVSMSLKMGLLLVVLSVLTLLSVPNAMALSLTVQGITNPSPLVDPAAEPAVSSGVAKYRWLIEEDKTYHVPLNPDGSIERVGSVPAIDPNWRVDEVNRNTVSVSFHHSYMPVVAKGSDLDPLPSECPSIVVGDPCLDRDKNYFISVLPDSDFSIGGTQIKADPINGHADVTVYVNKNPIPTTQITIFVHADIAPINNVWDLGENGLEGFSIILEDAGGKYGASAGIQSLDAFGNPICTSYQYNDTNGNQSHDPSEIFVSDPVTGEPVISDPSLPGIAGKLGAGCLTGRDGTVTIRNLAPGKYGIMTVPPNAMEEFIDSNNNGIRDPGEEGTGNYISTNWVQTSTIEGTKLIDAWVKANEPAFFGEFGPPGPHVSIGYVPAGPGPGEEFIDTTIMIDDGSGATIDGQVVNLHLSAPPDTAFYSGGPFPHTTPWVGLNMGAAGLGKGIYAARANEDGTFSIPNVPPGSFQLVVWDDNLDLLFSKNTVVVNAKPIINPTDPLEADGTCNTLTSCSLGDVPVFQWFARMEHYVYNDVNENGMWDAGELPMIEQNVNLRFRDGTIYQAFPTDGTGIAPFDQVFPFFSWLVAEVDFARYKATGATVVVDDGGAIPFGDPWAFDDNLAPQLQNIPADPACSDPLVCTETSQYRTELGPVLTEGFQAFLGQTNVVEWGKATYGPGENGGISGMVMYAVTRAEDDPELAAAEPWEPGIPRVTVNLYSLGFDRQPNTDDDIWIATTETDSWDDSLPTGCKPGANREPFIFRGVDTDCYDGMRVWNQVRPGVFDGGYAFTEICTDGLEVGGTCASEAIAMPSGQYMVEVVPPHGYEMIKSQDRNVDFGDTFFPSPELLPPTCAGADYIVPGELSLFPGEAAPMAGMTLKMCDRKLVNLSRGANAAADFFLFTEVPIAGHFIGFILDDTANEFDPASPQFGEKYAPPFLPVSIRDWTGREISRTVSDEYGVYNALIPSTFTENLGQPSGISPNMLTTCMNAKTLANGDPDLLHNPQYSQFCYTFQYMPGSTTYLDTPVVPVAAFAGADQNPLDCALMDETPRIHSVDVTGAFNPGGPYIATRSYSGNVVVRGAQTITIKSMGEVMVPNPAYEGVGGAEPKTIIRDYGFGVTEGTLNIGDLTNRLKNIVWKNDVITAELFNLEQIPQDKIGGRQLTITRATGKSTTTGVTVQVGLRGRSNGRPAFNGKVISVPADYLTIQEAIDVAQNRDLILVAPGTYNEMVIMWKPVQLQGWGEGSVTIDAIKTPFEKLAEWRRKVENLDRKNLITRAPGQELGFGGIEPETFFSEEGAGVFVLARSSGGSSFSRGRNRNARIDGFTITGADTGGGVVLNAYVDYMDVSNNRIVNNSAFFAAGVRIGHPMLTDQVGRNQNARLIYSDSNNDFDRIHHNTITQNGGLSGAGGGLALHTGSDNYQVTDNFVCGNFTTASGAGIAHYGRSNNGLIKGNTVIFNENFNQGITVNGGGILVSGLPPLGCPFIQNQQNPACLRDRTQALSPGAGSVEINANLIQGNSAGAGDGGGIRLSRINGQEVFRGNGQQRLGNAYVIDVLNNMIVNNVAALSGGGISMQDALAVNIKHNTIANNDITSTSGEAFAPGIPDESVPQPGAGIIARPHSTDLTTFRGNGIAADYSQVELVDNIIWQNRQFFWKSNTASNLDVAANGLCPDISGSLGLDCGLPTAPGGGDAPVYKDLWGDLLPPTCPGPDCILSDDIGADPAFVAKYVNGSRNTTNVILEGTTSMQAPPAFDEGGNFIRLRYGPLTQTIPLGDREGELFGDYHIQASSTALNAGSGSDAGIATDFDGEPRPAGSGFDIGADELQP